MLIKHRLNLFVSDKMESFNTSLEDISIPISDEDNCELVLSHKDLTDVMQKSEYNFTDHNEQKEVLFEFIKSKLCIEDNQVEIIKSDLLAKITFFLLKASEKYIKSSRKYERFLSNNQLFLSKNFDLPKLPRPSKQLSQPNKRNVNNIVRV